MGFLVPKDGTFDVFQTLECGQVFRYQKQGDCFTVFSHDKKCEITEQKDSFYFHSNNENYFKNYFDFDTNYDIIQNNVQDKGLISSAIEFGKGIHILNQNASEVIISFIISSNNNIKRIKAIIERMCCHLGEKKDGYFAFPTLSAIAEKDEKFFSEMGAGYRAKYIVNSARELKIVNFDALKSLSTDELRQYLTSLPGIGRKVADCILLFGFRRTEVFPVDTWIEKAFQDELGSLGADKMAKILAKRYGENSGYVQQWLYFYKRSLNVSRRDR